MVEAILQENINSQNIREAAVQEDPKAADFHDSIQSKKQKFMAQQAQDPILNSSSDEEGNGENNKDDSENESSG